VRTAVLSSPSISETSAPPERVLVKQLDLLCRNWVRAPLPVLALWVYIAYLVWGHVGAPLVIGWGAVTVGVLLLRSAICRHALREGLTQARPGRWARRFVGFALINGAIAGAAAPLFLGDLPAERQAILIMLMGCWGAGTIAANGAYPPAFYAMAIPLFAEIGAGWAIAGGRDLPFILLLLAMFVLVLWAFVRDNGIQIVESIRLRYENEQLLGQKEQLIALLRSAFEKAEAARTKAEDANRSKSQFLASASHDLRQPLHALSLLTALLNDLTDDMRVREVGRHIGQSVQSLDRLFGALLDLSKLDAGVVRPELHDVDLADLLAQLSIEYRPKAQDKGLEFAIDCAPLRVRADPILLERIIRNLLENAMRFTRAGKVSVRCQRQGSDAAVSVVDSGPGIPKSEHSRIFDEFYQLHNPGRDRSMGLGLGLSIVRRLADLLGYRIDLESAPGLGSTFTVTLPGAALDGPGDMLPRSPERLAADVAGLKVLLIEDDAEVRGAMDLTLRRWGCEPLIAASLEDANALLNARGLRPDAVLSDLRLASGASGIDAIASLRARFAKLPAALVTGDIAGERLLEVRSTGLPVLHKPVEPDALRELLHSLARESVRE
jgi:signal transduction histidine kinase